MCLIFLAFHNFIGFLSFGGLNGSVADGTHPANETYLVDLKTGETCLQSQLPVPMFFPMIQVFRNRLIVCSSYLGMIASNELTPSGELNYVKKESSSQFLIVSIIAVLVFKV